jgi:hypothetical protein
MQWQLNSSVGRGSRETAGDGGSRQASFSRCRSQLMHFDHWAMIQAPVVGAMVQSFAGKILLQPGDPSIPVQRRWEYA